MDASGIDLRRYVYQLLELAKENLTRDGCLLPAVFLVTPKQILIAGVTFQTPEEKQQAYQGVVEEARARNALAVITLNDARYSAGNVEAYYPGKLAAEDAPECILATVSGPDITNWEVMVPYRRTGSGFEFSPPEERSGGAIGLLPGWAENPAE